MSSTGQIVGGLGGAVIGFFASGGNPMGALYGAQIGMGVGGMIDPPKGPNIQGPRLSDLTVQTSTYGAHIPRIYGSVAITGNVFWLEKNKLKEVAKEEDAGGKGGGGGSSVTTYSYYATFAVGICKGPILGIGRIWVGSELIYDPADYILEKLPNWVVYTGTDVQDPDPRIQADRGVADTPAYRGLAYIVFYDFPLKKHGNSLLGAQVKVEVVTVGASITPSTAPSAQVVDLEAQGTFADGFCYNPLLDEIWVAPHYPNGVTRLKASDLSVVGVIPTPGLAFWPRYVAHSKNIVAASSTGFYVFDAGTATMVRSLPVGAWDFGGIPRDYEGSTAAWVFNAGVALTGGRMWIVSGGAEIGATTGEILLISLGTGDVLDRYHVGVAPFRMLEDREGRLWMLRNSDAGSAIRLSCLEVGLGVTADYETPYFTPDIMVYDPDRNSIWMPMMRFVGIVQVRDLLGEFDIDSRTFTSQYTLPHEWLIATDSVPLAYDGDRKYVWVGGEDGQLMGVDVRDGSIDELLELGPSHAMWTIADLEYHNGSVYACDSGFGKVAKITARIPGTITTISNPITLGEIISAECLQTGLLTASDIDVTGLTQVVRGYRITDTAAIRGALDSLQAAWPFDVVPQGYKIRFKPRGGASVATIPASDLDARGVTSESGPQITVSRELDSMIPQRLTLKTLDPDREYDTGEQSAERLNVASVNVREAELPIVLTATETAQAAERLLHMYWLERVEVGPFRLPPTYLGLEPADVVGIQMPDATYRVRLTSVQYTPDGRLECTGKLDSPAVYTPAAIGEVGDTTGVQVVRLEGATRMVPMDLPLMRTSENLPGFPIAIAGYLSAWPGGVVIRSSDGGVNWTDVAASMPPGSNIGVAATSMGVGRTDIFDAASTLTVKMASALQSVSELQVFSGANLFAYGADGRWEVISVKNCTLQGDGSWVLTNFLRGRFGTEWAMSTHAVGDTVVALNPSELNFVPVESSAIGLAMLYRGITDGRDIDSDVNTAFTYRGVNLECLSPVYLNGDRHPTTRDWTLTWVRRTRTGGEWRDFVDAMLSETTEAYEIDIFSDGTYTTLKRTLTATSATVAYTSAQQVTDFGSDQSTLFVKIYQMSNVVGRGYPLTTSITRG